MDDNDKIENTENTVVNDAEDKQKLSQKSDKLHSKNIVIYTVCASIISVCFCLSLFAILAFGPSLISRTGNAVIETVDSGINFLGDKFNFSVKMNHDASYYKNQNYLNVRNQMSDAGFKKIEIEKNEDLLFKSSLVGKVTQITIAGKDDFKEGDSFGRNKIVRIYYHSLVSEEKRTKVYIVLGISVCIMTMLFVVIRKQLKKKLLPNGN